MACPTPYHTPHHTPHLANHAPAILVLALATPAMAQAISMDIQPPGLPGQIASITLSASYDDAADYAIAGIATSLVADVSHGEFFFSNPRLVAPMDGPGTSAGVLHAAGADGIIAGQLNFPLAGIFADPTNPIAFWQVDYTYEIDPRTGMAIMDLSTQTSRFDVYVDMQSATSESRLGELSEGVGAVVVYPAPGTGAALLAGMALASRRRR